MALVVFFVYAVLTYIASSVVITWLLQCVWSPLASIPGPRLAACSYLYEIFYDCFQPAQYVFRIKQLHERYGPVIRINPDAISVSDLSLIDTIYDPPGQPRDKPHVKNKTLGNDQSLGTSWQHDLHKLRRRGLSRFFSQRAVLDAESVLREKLSKIRQNFAQAASNGTILNLSDLYFAFANDVVCTYAFGHDQNALADMTRAKAMRENAYSVLSSGKININFPWIKAATMWLPPTLRARLSPRGISDLVQFRMGIRKEITQVLKSETEKQTAASSGTTVFHELRQSPILPQEEKSAARLEDEAILVVMAGTESPAKSITIAQYYLLARPDIMSTLRRELIQHEPGESVTKLQQLPYLNAIIIEANRLSFGLTGRNPRVSPNEPMVLTTKDHLNPSRTISYQIPAGTPVSLPTLVAHTDESIFPDPWTFDPMRWISNGKNAAELEQRRKCMLSFSKGPRICIGMNLANAEMALCIAEMSKWDMKLWQTDEDDVKFLHDFHVAMPKLGSQGVRCRVSGRWTE